MKNLSLFIVIAITALLFSSCATFFKKEPPRLIKVDNKDYLSKSCDYTDYIKVAPVNKSEVIHMMGRHEVVYFGSKYKNSKKCYGNTIIVRDTKNGNLYYFHLVGRLYNSGKKIADMIASTRRNKDKNNRFFMFKATDKDGNLLDLDKELMYIDAAVRANYRAIQNGLFLAG